MLRREVVRQIGCQDITLPIGYTLEVFCIVVIGRDVYTLSVFIHTTDVLEAVFLPECRFGILAHQPHHELFLTLHGIEGDVLQSVPDYLAISPSCFVNRFYHPFVHRFLQFFFFD